MMKKILPYLALIVFLILAVRFTPWDRVNWGKIEMLSGSQITVTGEADQQLKTQIAYFNVSVTHTDDDKQTATDQVNQEMDQVIKAIKDFGIEDKDIQTQNVSVYQEEEPRALTYPVVDKQSSDATKGQWRASNSVEVILRDITKAADLAELLSDFDSTNVSGPRYSVDDTSEADTDLLKAAIDDARSKAQVIAEASRRKLGKVLTVSEGQTNQIYPLMRAAAEVGDSAVKTPVEPGSETITKTVTVTFELK